jgi:hypothetical protein
MVDLQAVNSKLKGGAAKISDHLTSGRRGAAFVGGNVKTALRCCANLPSGAIVATFGRPLRRTA